MDANYAIFMVFKKTSDNALLSSNELLSLFLAAKLSGNKSEFYWFKKTALAMKVIYEENKRNVRFNKKAYEDFCKKQGFVQ